MARLLLLGSGALFACAQTTQLWHKYDDVAVFSSAAVSRRTGTTPTFSTASWLNPPIAVSIIGAWWGWGGWGLSSRWLGHL